MPKPRAPRRLTKAQQTQAACSAFIVMTLQRAVESEDFGDLAYDATLHLDRLDTTLCTTDAFFRDDANVAAAFKRFIDHVIGTFQQVEDGVASGDEDG